MWYYIYRETEDLFQQQIGRARFEADADAMLDRWPAGYITHQGVVIKQNNMFADPWFDKTEET